MDAGAADCTAGAAWAGVAGLDCAVLLHAASSKVALNNVMVLVSMMFLLID